MIGAASQLPGRRIDDPGLALAGAGTLRNAISTIVGAPFAYFCRRQALKLDHLWPALCILGAVYPVFRS